MNWHDLKIALVGPVPPPAGGMANQTLQLAQLLRSEGATVELIPVNSPYRPAWIANIKGLRAMFRLLFYLRTLWQSYGQVNLVHIMANSGWSWHLFAAPAVWLASLRRLPIVVNYRGGAADSFLARKARTVRFTMRQASILALPSSFLLEVFGRYGMPGEILPNIVDLNRFRPSDHRKYTPRTPHLIVARNLEPIYGIDVALQAFALIRQQFPGAMLSIAGEGAQKSTLIALAESLGISDAIRLTGRLDRDEMALLYGRADIMLNPSRIDNMPNAILEALASGVPIVSTVAGGIPHMVRHEHTALLVPIDDASAMADATLRILSNDNLRQSLIAAGLEEASQYCWNAVREDLFGIYIRLAACRQ